MKFVFKNCFLFLIVVYYCHQAHICFCIQKLKKDRNLGKSSTNYFFHHLHKGLQKGSHRNMKFFGPLKTGQTTLKITTLLAFFLVKFLQVNIDISSYIRVRVGLGCFGYFSSFFNQQKLWQACIDWIQYTTSN